MTNNYHEQSVKILLNKDSELYRRIDRLAMQKGVPIEVIVDALMTLGDTDVLLSKIEFLEQKSL